jgi:hypothetical protein
VDCLISGRQPSNSKSIFDGLLKKTLTIILVGETGVGKTAFLDLLSNVCQLRGPSSYEFVHKKEHEQGGDKSKSQTLLASMYEFHIPGHSVTVKILDTPGFADTRGIQYDDRHRDGITRAIKEQIEELDAVLVMANGTVERLGSGTKFALATISTMFPTSIIGNTGFLYTNVASRLDCNTQKTSIPEQLRGCKDWTLQNPIAQHAKYLDVKARTIDPADLDELQRGIDKCHDTALETLKKLFTWVDGCDSIPTTEIVKLAQKRGDMEVNMANILAIIKSQNEKLAQIRNLRDEERNSRDVRIVLQLTLNRFNLVFFQMVQWTKDFTSITNTSQWKIIEDPTQTHHTLCERGGCFSNCHLECHMRQTMDRDAIGRRCSAFKKGKSKKCIKCGHGASDHQHWRGTWQEQFGQEVNVNEDIRRRHSVAEHDLRSVEGRRQALEEAQARSQATMNRAVEDLGQLCHEFNAVAISGSFSGFISSRIVALEEEQETMKMSGSVPEALEGMKDSINLLKGQLEVIQMAEATRKNKSSYGGGS